MLIQDMAEANGRVHGAALDAVTRALWTAVATRQIGDEDAARLSAAIKARRALGKTVDGFKPFPRAQRRHASRNALLNDLRRSSGPAVGQRLGACRLPSPRSSRMESKLPWR